MLKFQYSFTEDLTGEGVEIQNAVKNMAPIRDWLIIELFCFYVYLHATVLFIMHHQITNWYSKKPNSISDIDKTKTDFILYRKRSLVWFALNFVLAAMPLIIVGIVYNRHTLEPCPTAVVECGNYDKNCKAFTWVFLTLSFV